MAHAHSAGDVVAHNEAADVNIGERRDLTVRNSDRFRRSAPPAKRRAKRRDDDDDQAPRKRALLGLLDAVQANEAARSFR